MSSIKKAVKRVFRPIKKIAKKIAKPALIIGATLFTAGIVSGGFTAFSSVGAAGTLGGKINAFMGAVGETIGKGASALTGGLFGGGEAAAGATSAAGGVSKAGAAVGKAAFEESIYGTSLKVAAETTSGGFLQGALKALGNFAKTDAGKLVIAQGIMSGINAVAAGREARRKERRYDTSAVMGVQRRGSGGESSFDPSQYELTGPEGAGPMPSAEQYDPNRAIPPTPLLPQPQQYTATPAPAQNPSPAWGGPTQPVLPPQNYEYDYRYMQGGYNTPGMGGGLLSPIPPNYG